MKPSDWKDLQSDGPDNRSVMPLRLMRLEERIVLDAAGVIDGDPDSSAADYSSDHASEGNASPPDDARADTATPDPANSADPITRDAAGAVEQTVAALLTPDHSTKIPHRVLAISSALDESEALAAAAAADVVSTIFDGQDATLDNLLQQIRDALDGQAADSIALATHGVADGGFELAGGHVVNLATLQDPEMQAFWVGLADLVKSDGRIDLLACDAAAGADGRALLAALEDLTGIDFAASVNDTGNDAHGGDWLLETDRIDVGSIYFDSKRLSGFSEILANPPTIADTDPGNTANGGGGAVVVDAGITVTAGDTGDMQGALVRIKTGFVSSEDVLAYNTGLATGYGISGAYDATTGELALSGAATAAEYQDVLRTVTYQNTNATPDATPREIFFVVGDDFDGYRYNAAIGHYYELVNSQVWWDAAETAANSATLNGLQGYLATITSAAENTFVTNGIAGGELPWLGANDATVEGDFGWVAGPETGTQFWTGGLGGSAVGGMYANWNAAEPDNLSNSDHVHMDSTGEWFDDKFNIDHRYVVEYGGMATDAEGQLTTSVMVLVNSAGNDAPVLDNTGDMSLTAINEDNTASAGNTVASVIASAGGDRITDADGDPEGIAITAIDNTNGTWQYSINGGTNWFDIGAVAGNNGLLLRDTDLVRFQPDADWNGTVASGITFRAWDQTSGTAGNYANASVNGGNTALSTATETASLAVNGVNDAPALDNSGAMILTAINEDDTSSAGNTIASIIASAGGDRVTDVDAGALEGFAIIGIDNTNGSWQYSTNGGTNWSDIGAVAGNNALLLSDTDLVRFQPSGDWNGSVASGITFRAWDQTSGTAGTYIDASVNGGTTAFSTATETASLAVNGVNDAPVLDNSGAMILTAINEDDTGSAGNTVASIIASAGGDRVTDIDAGALEGFAITAIDNSNGTWQYSTDGGTSWSIVGAVTGTNALLLRDTDLVRFQPGSNWNGSVASGITFRAWDQTSGAFGTYVDASTTGDSTAFSTATETASLAVNGVNDAPVLDNSGAMILTAINEDDTGNVGNTVASIIASAGGDRVTDVDAGALEGFAIIGIDNTNGTWQYSTNGGTNWSDIGAVAGTNGLLLRDTDRVRFRPDADWNGTVASGITFRAWDRTSGTAGTYTDASTAGGATAFSAAVETASLVVNNVNDVPIVANPLVDQNATEDSVFTYQFAANTFTDVDLTDTLTYTAALADGNPLPMWLSFDSLTRTFSGTPENDDVGTLNVKVTVNDGNSGIATDTFAITVSDTNDAPTVANPLIDQTADQDTAFSYQFAVDAFEDVDVGDTLTYSATLADGSPLPDWLTFDAAIRTFSGTPGNGDVGTLDVEVTAVDGSGDTVSDTFSVTVSDTNDAPAVSNPLIDQTADEDTAFTYQFAADTFEDVDVDDTLSYSATLADGSPLPDWLTFDAATLTFSGTPLSADVETLNIEVTADDGNGETVSDTFTITVSGVNDAPTVADPLVDQTATADVAFTYQFAAGTFEDVDADDVLTYSATLTDGSPLPGWLAFDTATNTFSGTPGGADVGGLSVKVTADDGNGGTVSDTFIIAVSDGNDAPMLANPLIDQDVTEGEALTYLLAPETFIDADAGDTLGYAATRTDGSPLPGWLSFDPTTRTFSGTPGSADIGTLNVRVTVNDGHGGTAVDTFIITVSEASEELLDEEPLGEEPPDLVTVNPGPPPSNDASPSAPADTAPADTSSTTPGDGGALAADPGDAASSDGADSADAGDTADASDSADGGEAADGDAAGEAGDAGAEASSTASGADGQSSGNGGGPNGPGRAGGGQETSDARRHEREDEVQMEASRLSSEINNAMFSDDLLHDESQPEQFRDAWNSILSVYADSGEEVSAFLQSAFRAVTESAVTYLAAEQSIETMNQELTLAAEAELLIDGDALLTEIREASEDVKAASSDLEAAILAAAEAGKQDRFDRVLEDVIGAALQRLMTANGQLFIETQMLTATVGVLRDARINGQTTLDDARLESAVAQAKLDADATVTEMRERWDRIAQDVFSAFVDQMVAERGKDGEAVETG